MKLFGCPTFPYLPLKGYRDFSRHTPSLPHSHGWLLVGLAGLGACRLRVKACRGSESVRLGRRALAYQTSLAFLKEEKSALAADFNFVQWFLFLLLDSWEWQRLEGLLLGYLASLEILHCPASVPYFINRKAESGTLQEVETGATNEKVYNFCLLILLPLGSWLSWSVSQPLCPHVLSPEVSSTPWDNRVAGWNRAASASQPLQCRQLVPCGRVRGTGTCPRAVWRPSQIWVGLRVCTVVAFWTQMCDGN